jgi:hypothetical protein
VRILCIVLIFCSVGCKRCFYRENPVKVEHSFNLILKETSPYKGPPDITIESGLKW